MRFQLDPEDWALLEDRIRCIVKETLDETLADWLERERQSGLKYTLDQIAEKEGVSRQTVRNWIDAGKLRKIQVGGRVFVRASDYATFKDSKNSNDIPSTK